MEKLVIEKKNINDLQNEVNRLIQDGYEPLGELTTSSATGEKIYHQTMVKKSGNGVIKRTVEKPRRIPNK